MKNIEDNDYVHLMRNGSFEVVRVLCVKDDPFNPNADVVVSFGGFLNRRQVVKRFELLTKREYDEFYESRLKESYGNKNSGDTLKSSVSDMIDSLHQIADEANDTAKGIAEEIKEGFDLLRDKFEDHVKKWEDEKGD